MSDMILAAEVRFQKGVESIPWKMHWDRYHELLIELATKNTWWDVIEW